MNQRTIVSILMVILCLSVSACSAIRSGSGSTSAVTMNSHTMVRSSLDGLITAYEAKSGSHFSGLVSDSYQGEKRVLDKAVMRDFGTFHNLSIRYTVNNITLGDNGMVSVAITFTRGWTDIKTTNTMSETRETSLVFVLEDNVYRLLSQGRPQLFGFN